MARFELRLREEVIIDEKGAPHWKRAEALPTNVWAALEDNRQGGLQLALGIDDAGRRNLVITSDQADRVYAHVRRDSKYRITINSPRARFVSLSPFTVSTKKMLEKVLKARDTAQNGEMDFEVLRALSHVSRNIHDGEAYGVQISNSTPIPVVALSTQQWSLDETQRLSFQITSGNLRTPQHVTYNYQNKAFAALKAGGSCQCTLQYESEEDGYAKLEELLQAGPALLVVLSRNKDIERLLQDAGITLHPSSTIQKLKRIYAAPPTRARSPQRSHYDSRARQHDGRRNDREPYPRSSRDASPRRGDSRHDSRARRDYSPRRRSRSRSRSPRRRSRSVDPPEAEPPCVVIVDYTETWRNAHNIAGGQVSPLQPHCKDHHTDELFHAFRDTLEGPPSFVRDMTFIVPAARTPCTTGGPVPPAAPVNPPQDEDEDEADIEPELPSGQPQKSVGRNPYDDDSDDDDDDDLGYAPPSGQYSANQYENTARMYR
ncbi:hypothetical protein EXIGLDRAFT_840026 [Exidia glandulosa HHB12029]|uniref:Uncharacterized protein n=1 Tax=Exidia glandulosa HHB12029 TaxID=1314781 RepID=A0A165EPD3_EXIGL|nr:hypothetical protein EXIGLDRAFT_840026 [Exidia glandulosa HHB12029]